MKNEDDFAEDKHGGGRVPSLGSTGKWPQILSHHHEIVHVEAMAHTALSTGQGKAQHLPHQVSSEKQD